LHLSRRSFSRSGARRYLPSFPTRRSSDLYRKLHDDLLDQGETCCPNRVARLASLAGIKARIGYKRRPGSYGGKSSKVVDNTLARSEEHTSELQSRENLVCRRLLEKKKQSY